MVKKSEKDTWRICLGPDVLRKGNSNAELFEAITKSLLFLKEKNRHITLVG